MTEDFVSLHIYIWKETNGLIASNTLRTAPNKGSDKPVQLKVKTIRLMSGCIDYPTQYAGIFSLGVNNTYDIPFLDKSVAGSFLDQYSMAGLCKNHYLECQKLMKDGRVPYGDKAL